MAKLESHLLLLTPKLHPITDAIAHIVSNSWRNLLEPLQVWCYLLFPQILDLEILMDFV